MLTPLVFNNLGVTSGVLLVGHGTRDAVGTAEFFQLSNRLAAQIGNGTIVRPCLLEFQQPTIVQAWNSLIEQGVGRVTVAPLLLFAAGHAKSDIPGEVAAARAAMRRNDAVQVRYARPISRQTAMIEAVRHRVRETFHRVPAGSAPKLRTAIVMVGRGSRDVCASSDMRMLSEVAVRGRVADTNQSLANELEVPADGLFTTFYAMAEPRLPDTLSSIAATGRFERIVVQPHLLFAGRLYDAIVEQTNRVAAAHRSLRFDVASYLGPCDMVAAAIAARIHEASRPTAPLSTDGSARREDRAV